MGFIKWAQWQVGAQTHLMQKLKNPWPWFLHNIKNQPHHTTPQETPLQVPSYNPLSSPPPNRELFFFSSEKYGNISLGREEDPKNKREKRSKSLQLYHCIEKVHHQPTKASSFVYNVENPKKIYAPPQGTKNLKLLVKWQVRFEETGACLPFPGLQLSNVHQWSQHKLEQLNTKIIPCCNNFSNHLSEAPKCFGTGKGEKRMIQETKVWNKTTLNHTKKWSKNVKPKESFKPIEKLHRLISNKIIPP